MGEQRKRTWKSGCGGDGESAQKRSRHGGAFGAAANAKGSTGILVTCDKTKEKQSVKDILNVLNEVADEFFPPSGDVNAEASANDKETTDSVQQKLQQEIQELQSASSKRQTGRFIPLDTGVKGVFLVQFAASSPPLCPIQVVSKVFEQLEATHEFASRFVQRLIPLQEITYSSVDSIQAALKPLVAAAFDEVAAQSDNGVVEYAVEVKRRNCSNLATMDVINGCVALVDAKHKVNLTTPQLVIVVEIFRSTCGVSLVRNFHSTRRFNVRSVLDPPPKGNASTTNSNSVSKSLKDAEKKPDTKSEQTQQQSEATEISQLPDEKQQSSPSRTK